MTGVFFLFFFFFFFLQLSRLKYSYMNCGVVSNLCSRWQILLVHKYSARVENRKSKFVCRKSKSEIENERKNKKAKIDAEQKSTLNEN
jgi:hypothetical protein